MSTFGISFGIPVVVFPSPVPAIKLGCMFFQVHHQICNVSPNVPSKNTLLHMDPTGEKEFHQPFILEISVGWVPTKPGGSFSMSQWLPLWLPRKRWALVAYDPPNWQYIYHLYIYCLYRGVIYMLPIYHLLRYGSQKTTPLNVNMLQLPMSSYRGFKATDATGVAAVTELTDVTRW